MSSYNPASIMYAIVQKKESIDRMSKRLNNGQTVFMEISREMPKLSPPELGLLRVVSWFYVLYYEAGGVNVDFLAERLTTYNLDSGGNLSEHLTLVNQLRTYFQHNLDPSSRRDRRIQDYCEMWFRSQCGTSEPNEDAEWDRCLHGFLQEAMGFVDALLKCIREIERDESFEQVLNDWDLRRSRYHPAYEFDQLINEVAVDMGRDSLDAAKFRKRYYDRWIKEIASLQGDYTFEFEARRLIEYTLLNDTMAVLPITGKEILETFEDIQPGPEVGEFLQRAKTMYEENPCTREELLEKLRNTRKPE